ncbi:MAG: glycosyltransferase family 39 protein [Acidobacteria bacterium]|nr:glycosyltransferase family 39 protein [Acidobacteriota bacterium]
MNEWREKVHWIAALTAGGVLRLLFARSHPYFSGDALMYGELAHNMLAHHLFGFSDTVLRPTLIRLPGYPLFLAACFAVFGNANYHAVVWIQIAIDLYSCALMGLLAFRFAGRRAGLFAVWLAALCPFTANYSVVVLTETLTLFCIVAAYVFLEQWDARWRKGQSGLTWAFYTGIALSFAVLLRPDQGLLAAAIVPVMLWVSLRHRHARAVSGSLLPAAIASLVVVLPLLAWTARNWRTFHVLQPLAPRYANDPDETVPYGFQRWYRTWAIDLKATYDVYWNYNDTTMNLADLPSRAFDSPAQRAQTRVLYEQYNQTTTASPALDEGFAQIAAARITAHPLRYYVVMPAARELDMWLRPRTELMALPIDWWSIRPHPGGSAVAIAYALLNAAYLVLGVVGLLRWRAHAWNTRGAVAFAMLSFVAMRCLLLLTLDNSEPRYTLECFPIVIVLASFISLPKQTSHARSQAINDLQQ